MFSQKHVKKYSISTPEKELNLIGISRAAKATCFYCPELKIMLDAGCPMEYVPNIVVITHLHWDHVAEIMRVLLSAEKTKNPLLIVCPYPSIGYLKNLIEASYHTTKRTLLDNPVKYPPHAIIGCKIEDTRELSSIIVDLSRKSTNIIGRKETIFERGNFIKYEEGDINDQLKKMANPIEILGMRCEHTQVATGYGFSEMRYVMKDEYMDINKDGKRKCKLAPEEIKNLRENGKLDEYMIWKRIPLFAFLCDTDHNVFNENAPYNGKWVIEYPILVIECTFFDESDIKKAKKDKHMHWINLEPFVKKYSNIKFKLIHLSERYTLQQLCNFRKSISCYDNVELLIDFGNEIPQIKKMNKKVVAKKEPIKKIAEKKRFTYEIYGGYLRPNSIMETFSHRTVKSKKASSATSEILNKFQSDLLKTETPPKCIEYYFSVKNKETNELKYFHILGTIQVNIKKNKTFYKFEQKSITYEEFSKQIPDCEL